MGVLFIEGREAVVVVPAFGFLENWPEYCLRSGFGVDLALGNVN